MTAPTAEHGNALRYISGQSLWAVMPAGRHLGPVATTAVLVEHATPTRVASVGDMLLRDYGTPPDGADLTSLGPVTTWHGDWAGEWPLPGYACVVAVGLAGVDHEPDPADARAAEDAITAILGESR